MEKEKERSENGQSINSESSPSLKANPPRRKVNTAKMTYPEYSCFFPTIFFRGPGACEQDCPEEVRENAKCERNGWRWAERMVELRAEELKIKRKTMADRDREKGEKEQETEEPENDNT